eukprot:Clim_evm98s210 gene=Clim_evmTU98s210
MFKYQTKPFTPVALPAPEVGWEDDEEMAELEDPATEDEKAVLPWEESEGEEGEDDDEEDEDED